MSYSYKKKIEFKHSDIIFTKSGYEVCFNEIYQTYYSKNKGVFVEFYVPVCWNPETREREQLKTIKQKQEQWSSMSTKITDKFIYIKRPTCKLKLIS